MAFRQNSNVLSLYQGGTMPMSETQKLSFMEASGEISYNMTNNFMFRYILQENQNVLKGLILTGQNVRLVIFADLLINYIVVKSMKKLFR